MFWVRFYKILKSVIFIPGKGKKKKGKFINKLNGMKAIFLAFNIKISNNKNIKMILLHTHTSYFTVKEKYKAWLK